MNELLSKIESYSATIGVLGLGYVGLPLAISFSKKYSVYGFDPNSTLVDRIKNDEQDVNGVPFHERNALLRTSFIPTSNLSDLSDCDVYLICVPTPLKNSKRPDLSYIRSASNSLVPYITKNKLVVLESTTYPGTTEEMLSTILETSGYHAGKDFYIAFSPERIDPGNQTPLEEIPKIIGGFNKESSQLSIALYSQIFNETVEVSNSKTAEAVKLYENIFRLVNIGLVNELSLIFDQLGINTWEVISAASTKPYGFMPFYPGPGIGGHCIPLDPFYLTYRAERAGISSQYINLADQINDYMKLYVIGLVESSLKENNIPISESKISIFGLTYKNDVDDTRESPSIDIIEELLDLGCALILYDPYVDKIVINDVELNCVESVEESFNQADCALFLVNHSQFRCLDINTLSKKMKNKIVIDCKNIFDKNNLDIDIFLTGIGKNYE